MKITERQKIKCIKDLLKRAEWVIEKGLEMYQYNFRIREQFWKEISENYDRYLDGECGDFLKDLDMHFRGKFEGALAILAWSFKRNGELYPPAGKRYNDRELEAVERVISYNVFEIYTKDDIMKMIMSKDPNILNLLRNYYWGVDKWIEDALNDPSIKLPLRHFLKTKWESYKDKINAAISEATVHFDWFNDFLALARPALKLIEESVSDVSWDQLGNESVFNREGPISDTIVALQDVFSAVLVDSSLAQWYLAEFLKIELGLSDSSIEKLFLTIKKILTNWTKAKGAKEIDQQTLDTLTVEFIIRLVTPHLPLRRGSRSKGTTGTRYQKENTDKEWLECLLLDEELERYLLHMQLAEKQIACVKDILKRARYVIKNASKILRMDFYKRISYWNEIQKEYLKYEEGICGLLPWKIDDIIRTYFETALAVLALSFKKKKEKYLPATLRFKDSELEMLELILLEHRTSTGVNEIEISGGTERTNKDSLQVEKIIYFMYFNCSSKYLWKYLACCLNRQKIGQKKRFSEVENQNNEPDINKSPKEQSISNYQMITFKNLCLQKEAHILAKILDLPLEIIDWIGKKFIDHINKKPVEITEDGVLSIDELVLYNELTNLFESVIGIF